MIQREWTVTAEEVGVRLDKVLVGLQQGKSRHQIQNLIKNKQVLVNGIVRKANYVCRLNDHISWEIVDDEKTLEIESENILLSIIYEDDYLIVLNKPQGMIVHPTSTIRSGTLVNALKYYTKQLSTLSGEDRPGIVHRLDQDTSGVMVIAKDNVTHDKLKKQFQDRTAKRVYEAIVLNEVKHDKGVIKAPIGRNPKNRLQMSVVDDGRYAETLYKVIQRYKGMTHVQCQLITGRTHQIRVHMKYIQHPILGDKLYNRKKSALINHQALFSKELCFHHPETNEWQCYGIETPSSFEQVITHLNSKS